MDAEILWDNRRKFRIADLAQGTLGFIFRVHITSDQPRERVIELLQRAEDGCYASDALRNAVPMRAHLSLNGEEIHVQGVGGEVPDVP